jgi:protein involved in polysaccharide export with SLBB domain
MRLLPLFIFSFLFFAGTLQAVAVSTEMTPEPTEVNASYRENASTVFGYHLFNGSFSQNRQYRYNPDYLVNIGDTISLKLWGAFDLEVKLTVDMQGNVFIPKVGTVKVVGVRNDRLTETIQSAVNKVYKSNVFIYADLVQYQPVSVFVTGAVNKPGLYEGLSSDSVIQFLDKARGIQNGSGSYRDIRILRHNKVLKEVDLYDFLTDGRLELFQFRMGDVIVVEDLERYVDVSGDVKRPYRFELRRPEITLDELEALVLPNPTATNVVVTRWDIHNRQTVNIYALVDSAGLVIRSGESVRFIPDHTASNIEIEVSGEHENSHTLVVPKGTSLQEVFDKIKLSGLSDPKSFQLFRKSVAAQQKKLIDAQLNDLEAKVLTTGSITNEEALIRKQEAALVMNFIKRARAVEPKGQVVINKATDLSKVMLEDGDNIFIPKTSNMVIVQGEVMLPGAQTYVDSMSFDDYIASCGGYSFRADEDNVLIIQKNGKVVSYDPSSFGTGTYAIKPGDSILVLGKVDSKVLQVVKDITQIVYQIAVGAAVVINMN